LPKAKPRKLGRPPASLSAETRERIIDAGRGAFAGQGYDKTTNKDIADAAGLTTGALYHYFDSKQALFVAVLLDQQDRVVGRLREAAAPVDGAVDKLRAMLEETIRLNGEDPDLARFVATAPIELDRHEEFRAPLGTPEAVSRTGGLSDLLVGIVTDGQAAGELDPDVDPAAIVNMVLAAMSGLAQLAGFRRDPAALAAAVDAFERLLAGTLVTAGSASARLPRRRGRRRAAG
jgi:AcrR family transcriptional regulator